MPPSRAGGKPRDSFEIQRNTTIYLTSRSWPVIGLAGHDKTAPAVGSSVMNRKDFDRPASRLAFQRGLGGARVGVLGSILGRVLGRAIRSALGIALAAAVCVPAAT